MTNADRPTRLAVFFCAPIERSVELVREKWPPIKKLGNKCQDFGKKNSSFSATLASRDLSDLDSTKTVLYNYRVFDIFLSFFPVLILTIMSTVLLSFVFLIDDTRDWNTLRNLFELRHSSRLDF